MHPLSYQPLATSCWVTSMLNGILYLNNDRYVPFMAHRLLNNLHIEEGVFYYTKKQKKEFEAVIKAIGECAGIEITYATGRNVEGCLSALDFSRQVAVCDIGAGDHSILINGESDGVFLAFDPYWENVKKGESVEGEYETCPAYFSDSSYSVNLRVWKDHLFLKKKGNGFRMGAESKRFATVLTKPSIGRAKGARR
jgi:hypothetical protein